jgi:hypothetical protein
MIVGGHLAHCAPRLARLLGAPYADRRGAVAQMGERCNRTAEVRGSIPLSSTSLGAPAKLLGAEDGRQEKPYRVGPPELTGLTGGR